eukprot:4946116-Amphidinium_carterae.1
MHYVPTVTRSFCLQAADAKHASETWAAHSHTAQTHQAHKVPLRRQRRHRSSSQVGSANSYPIASWDPGTTDPLKQHQVH